MNRFGYRLSPSSQIDLDDSDNSLFREILAGEPGISTCIACGSCVASCSAGVFDNISFRKALHLLEAGMDKDAVALLEGCMVCGKCTLVCPRGINTRHAIVLIKRKLNKG
jgi:heterodisulfide reductase subunit C